MKRLSNLSDSNKKRVHFIHFNLSDEQIKKFKHSNTKIVLSIDHSLYNHLTKITQDTKNALIKDFI